MKRDDTHQEHEENGMIPDRSLIGDDVLEKDRHETDNQSISQSVLGVEVYKILQVQE